MEQEKIHISSANLDYDKMMSLINTTLIKGHFKYKKLEDDKAIADILSNFESLKQYEKVTLLEVFQLQDSYYESYLLLLTFSSIEEAYSSKVPAQLQYTETELLGLSRLSFDMGHTFIRPESLEDKLRELVVPVEIDFKQDKAFSRKFYVTSDQPKKLKANMPREFMTVLKKHKQIYLEVFEQNVLLRTGLLVEQRSIATVLNLLRDIDELNKYRRD